jgi:hypothetical protein
MASILLTMIVVLMAAAAFLLWRLTKLLDRIRDRHEQLTEEKYRTMRGESHFLAVATRTGIRVEDLLNLIQKKGGLERYKVLLQRMDEIEARFAEDGDEGAAVVAKVRAAYDAMYDLSSTRPRVGGA